MLPIMDTLFIMYVQDRRDEVRAVIPAEAYVHLRDGILPLFNDTHAGDPELSKVDAARALVQGGLDEVARGEMEHHRFQILMAVAADYLEA